MARAPFVVGNWKMNLLIREGEELARGVVEQASGLKKADVGVCPPFVALSAIAKVLRNSDVRLGAQNLHWQTQGAFTGEIAAPMLRDVGCRHVIIGHSERRHLFNESDEVINNKIQVALSCELEPIICVGETLQERQSQRTEQIIGRQVAAALKDLAPETWPRLTIAYEPVWAIGTGVNAKPSQAQEAHKFIRNLIAEKTSRETADAMRILYGGSVKPDNAKDLMSQPDVDGALVGGASLSLESFVAIIKAAVK